MTTLTETMTLTNIHDAQLDLNMKIWLVKQECGKCLGNCPEELSWENVREGKFCGNARGNCKRGNDERGMSEYRPGNSRNGIRKTWSP